MKKNFITGAEYSLQELEKIIHLAMSYKKGIKIPDLSGKMLTLIFANPSLRTHLSFESGMKKMKGEVNVLHAGNSWQFEYKNGAVMNGDKQEHVKEGAKVISRYSDVIALRQSELVTTASRHNSISSWEILKQDEAISKLATYAEKPVINMESNMFHPCQAMADVMTMKETFGNIKKKKYVLTWSPHIKALPLATPHSQLLMPALFGMNVTVVHPLGFDLDSDVLKMAQEKALLAGGSVKISHDQYETFKNADVVVAKSWASLQYFGHWDKESDYRKQFEHWILNEEKMKLTNNALFLHCLPVRRNIEVTDGVLDSPRSKVIDEAENRMWVQMALIFYLL
ncbi:N-acetylornithine carbamoyltransferase [Candidatus Peregrinibacteria bacterium]|nr:N-acetylornithine carbamoyltransferase [Candidatus Peregrinibacteria bacterium]